MIIYLVVRSERYGLGVDDPIAFETQDEAEDYIRASKEADDLTFGEWSFKLIPTQVFSRRKREMVLERIKAEREARENT